MPWHPFKLRDAEVWARTDDAGRLVTDAEGRVEIVYKAAPGAKLYRAGARNLSPRPGPPVELEPGEPAPPRGAGKGGAAGGTSAKGGRPGEVPAGAVAVWTDGACTGNPGPAGIGVVVLEGPHRRELSEFLGSATNNIAELTAIERGLELVEDRSRPVYVHSDSSYAIGLLSKNWKPKANVELVGRLRALTAGFTTLVFVKVPGHAGVPENERCDQLAREAIVTRRNRRGEAR